jgi:Fe-S oxidoreductase
MLFEEYVTRELPSGAMPLAPIGKQALLHGHCHQKAFGAMDAIGLTLGLVDGLEAETVESSCCGMAGAFGYGADTHAVSLAMGELSLLPAVRRAAADTTIAADGFSCRHQIRDGTGREALHVARILRQAMAETASGRSP